MITSMAPRWLACFLLLVGCNRVTSPEVREEPAPSAPPVVVSSARTSSAVVEAPPPAPKPLDVAPYPWHADASIEALPAVDALSQRFAPPAGFTRVKVAPGSFGAWLRDLPLAAPGTPVLSYDGSQLMPADHTHIAAVTTLDIGKQDLQQCADAVMRLHGEWLWQNGRASEASYHSGGGPIAWARYKDGWMPKPKGNGFVWAQGRAKADDHASYRKYLDIVFSWANTVALRQHSAEVARGEIRPGDFFILPGSPGHTVIVLDLARDAAGHAVALLGQSYMPAQSFQVLRPSRSATWFALDGDDGVETPFWPTFPWSSLHRLD
jgi:hypothetical protein